MDVPHVAPQAKEDSGAAVAKDDSSLENAAALSSSSGGPAALHRVEHINTMLEQSLQRYMRVPKGMPLVAHFLVGGEPFAIAVETLKREPTSLLFRMAVQHFSRGRCDGEERQEEEVGPIIIDKDPFVFRHLLNLLRGYKLVAIDHQLHPTMMEDLRSDAMYYGIMRSFHARFPPPRRLVFSGAGSLDGGRRLSSSSIVSVIQPFLESVGPSSSVKKLEMWVEVGQCDGPAGVLIGVVSRHLSNFASDCTTSRDCAMMYPTGDVVHTFAASRGITSQSNDNNMCAEAPVVVLLDEGSAGFTEKSIVKVVLDMESRRVHWLAVDRSSGDAAETSLKVLLIPREVQALAFAVVLQKNSQVQLLEPSPSSLT